MSIIYCLAQHDVWSGHGPKPIYFNKKSSEHSLHPVLIFKYINIFSDWWIMPDDIPDENTVNQLRPKRKDALGMTLKVNRKYKF